MAPTPHNPPPINRLILIGNGFDLAHKMKTSYGDFILWYFRDCWQRAKDAYVPSQTKEYKNLYIDNLITISFNPFTQGASTLDFEINNKSDLEEFVKIEIDTFKPRAIRCQITSEFFRILVTDFFSKNWVDIENYYYDALSKIVKNPNIAPRTREVSYPNLIKTNDVFLTIKELFEVYLSTLKPSGTIESLDAKLYEAPFDPTSIKITLGNVLFLNFNYTPTPEKYKQKNTDIIYIHGKLNDEKNPIIFGYGDERDDTYSTLEKANNPKVFTHIKSFDYFKTNNYTRLLAFLESEYDVYIMGHSCGLSDRTLLSTIFEHDNCRQIKIFYYNDMDRYRETTYEISRHFTSKAEMRRKVINFADCVPMPQLPS